MLYFGTQIALTGAILTLSIFFGIAIHAALTKNKKPPAIVMFLVLFALFLSLVAMPVGALIRIWF